MAGNLPTAKVLASVHSRVHFCREGAIVQLKGGWNRLVCRNDGRKAQYNLYLEENLLLDAHIAGISTLGARLKAGYGDGLMQEQACRAAAERVNQRFENLSLAVQRIAPLMGLMASGYYLVTDCELQPVIDHRHCLNDPLYDGEAKFTTGMGGDDFDAPLYFVPTQRASVLVPERIRYYMEWMERSDYSCPRAVALYLNGCVSLLLDGHHKAAAAAALGKRLKTLMIFPLQDEKAVAAAVRAGKKLDLCQGRWDVLRDCPEKYGAPLYLVDEDRKKVSCIQALEHLTPRNEKPFDREIPDWGSVPEEFCGKMEQYPLKRQLMRGTAIPPDRIKTVMRQVMDTPWPLPENIWELKGDAEKLWEWCGQIEKLAAFAKVFPESPMLTDQQRQWLERTCLQIERVLKR